jgi:hypothetical protein
MSETNREILATSYYARGAVLKIDPNTGMITTFVVAPANPSDWDPIDCCGSSAAAAWVWCTWPKIRDSIETWPSRS